MEKDKEIDKFAYCLGCLSNNTDNALIDYKINNGPLKTIIQADKIWLCYICRHLAQRTELFIQNVQSNQILLENVHNLTESIIHTARSQSQLICLTNKTLDVTEVGIKDSGTRDSGTKDSGTRDSGTKDSGTRDSGTRDSGTRDSGTRDSGTRDSGTRDSGTRDSGTRDSGTRDSGTKTKDVLIKLEVKDENGFLDHLEGEFIDDNDFPDSVVKEEDDDFPLKDLLLKEEYQNGEHVKLRRSLRGNRAEKKRKKNLKSKRDLDEEFNKEDFPLSDLLKDELDIEELVEETSEKKKSQKSKLLRTKDDLFKTQLVYITREQCMEERAKMALDKKYLDSTYKCQDCIKSFNFKESYDKHMRNHSEAMGDYECDICKQRTSSKEKLLRHKKCHEVRYRCVECGLTRINRLTIREHYNAFHLKVHSYTCPHCPKTFKRQVSQRKHIAYNHKNRVRVKCQYCQKTYANKEVLKAHIIVRHPAEISAGEVLKRYICQECGMAFKAPSQLRNHNIKHSHTRDYYCVECDKSFKTEAAFKQHVKIAAPHVNYMELPLPCTHCDKRFAIRRDLERHTNRVHLNIRPFQCDKCDRAYVNNWSLNEHKRFVHEGHKRPLKYPCSMCDKVFDRNQTLKAHVRTHTGERPFACARCPARFAQSGARDTHHRLVHLRLPRSRRHQ